MNALDLMKELNDGAPYDVTCHIKPENLEEELAELLYTWSVFESNPAKLQGAMRRHIEKLCERIAEEQMSCQDKEAEWLDACDRYYDERKDREAERG